MSARWRSRKDAAVTYRVEGSLGAGGQGEVSRVVRESDGAVFVLKTLHLQTAAADDAWKQDARLEREASVLERLSHRGLPVLIDRVERVGDDTGLHGFVQSLVPGESIAALTDRAGRIDALEFLRLTRELLSLLAHLHSRNPPIVHRDISPRNVLLARGPSGRASLIDFGAVRFPSDPAGPEVTTAGTFGTMAPEQMMGQAVPASDLYALGVTLLSLASGRAPTDLPVDPATGAIDVRAVVSLPEPIPTVLHQMTRVGLADRLGSAQAALDLLEGRAPSRASSVSDGVFSRALRAFRKRALWLVPTLVLVGGYIASVIPPDGQAAMLGGWFSGHGNIIGNITATFVGDPAAITSGAHLGPLAWSPATPNGADLILASTARDEARIWNVTNASQIGEVEVGGKFIRRVRHAAFSSDGHHFAFVSDERLVEAWQLDGETTKQAGSWPLSGDSDDAIVGLAVVGPQALRVARFVDDRLQVDDPASGHLVFLLPVEKDRNGNPLRLAPGLTRLSPDGERLIVIAEDTVRRYRLSDGALIDATPLGPSAAARNLLVVDADGDTFAITYQDSLEFWDAGATSARASVRFDYGTHFEGPHELALSPDGALAAFGDHDTLRLVDTRTGALRRVYEGHDGHVGPVAFSPDGRLLAAAATDGIVRVWQVSP